MNTHIDTLAEWWENAEQVDSGTVAGEGDHIITRKPPSPHYPGAVSYVARLLGKGEDYAIAAPYTRILSRAPKPKPAWHGAVAVMARCSNAPEGHREPFIRSDADSDVWAGEAGHARTEDLRDVTPLIEAEVTDEMVLAALNESTGLDLSHLTSFKRNEVEDMRFALTAALGIEAE